MKQLIYTLIISSIISSCGISALNFKHETPKKATKYPLFTEKDSVRGWLSEYRSNFDVKHYDLSVDFDLKRKSIKGKVIVTFEAVRDLNMIQLDLHENMAINKMECAGQSLIAERKFNAVFISFSEMVKAGEIMSLSIEYSGSPVKAKKPPWEGGFVWKKNKGVDWVGVACEQLGANIWWPVKDHLSDEPDSMDLHYTVPEGLMCVANGSLISRETKEGRTDFHWKVRNPINSYNVTFYIGDFVLFEQPYEGIDGMHKLSFYVLPQNLDKAKEHFKQTHAIMRFYEETFGVYPWWEDGFKLVESPFAGMEHQSAIAYGNGYSKNNHFGSDDIILHETAHEWWGNAITVSDFADVWLQEGFATYCEALYWEYSISKEQAYKNLAILAVFVQNKGPMVGPKEVNYWDYKDGDPYMKGALTLHSLRNTMDNDTLFMDILKSFYQKYGKKIVTSQDFIDHVNEKTGQDYTWFFDQFLYNRMSPKFTYYISTDESGQPSALHYKWTDVTKGFKMPVYIMDHDRWVRITPTTEAQTYTLTERNSDFRISKFEFYFSIEKRKF